MLQATTNGVLAGSIMGLISSLTSWLITCQIQSAELGPNPSRYQHRLFHSGRVSFQSWCLQNLDVARHQTSVIMPLVAVLLVFAIANYPDCPG